MTFGTFFQSVMTVLETAHNWGAPAKYLTQNPELLDLLYNKWQQSRSDLTPAELNELIKQTAELLDQSA